MTLTGLTLGVPFHNGATAAAFNPLSFSPLFAIELGRADKRFQDSGATTPATATGNPLGAILDFSGYSRHWTQSNSGKRSLLNLTYSNGKPYAVPDGADDFLGFVGAFINDNCQIWLNTYTTRTSLPGPGTPYVGPIIAQGTDAFPSMTWELYNSFGSTTENRGYFEGSSNPYIDGVAYTYPTAITAGQPVLMTGKTSSSSTVSSNTGFFAFSWDAGSRFAIEAINACYVMPNELTGANFTNMANYMLALRNP